MKFTLIHYTEGWTTGGCVELSTLPPIGTLIKSGAPECYNDIFYVDNILLADGGENYLLVRPFEGYGYRAPLTESDRLAESIREAQKEITQKLDDVQDHLWSIIALK